MVDLSTCLIDGNWQRASGNESFEVANPYTEEVITVLTAASLEQADLAIEAAARAPSSLMAGHLIPMHRLVATSNQAMAAKWESPDSKSFSSTRPCKSDHITKVWNAPWALKELGWA
jgi:acyl-CoA reductase-like NAD-dependent aldehyde dehydrogenase